MAKYDKYTKPRDVKEAVNFLCLLCDRVYKTPQGLMAQFWKTHGLRPHRVLYGKHWKVTTRKADY